MADAAFSEDDEVMEIVMLTSDATRVMRDEGEWCRF